MRILVLGGYGLIGREVVRRTLADGFEPVGFGRSLSQGRRAAPTIRWIAADLAQITTPEAWLPHLTGIDGVVNASGALQDGARDNLALAQDQAIRALIAACAAAGVRRFVQISAPGADIGARTAFMRTKGAADAALRASDLDWIIFKPGLVISANAYGGTSLLRMLAAFPLAQPLVLADRRMQTVAAYDVAQAVSFAWTPQAPLRRSFDLVAPEAHALRDVVARFRAWLGFAPAGAVIDLPRWLGFALARGADLMGWLGWRSPLRSTAFRVLDQDVLGDADAWPRATGLKLASLDQTLAALPATSQERLYARAQLVFPLLLATLASFWIASGLIGLWRSGEAAQVLAKSPLASSAGWLALAGAIADIAIGLALMHRRTTRAAAWCAVALSISYLALATIFTPDLWADPLGPLVKVFPGVALALAIAALAEDR